MFGSVHNPLSKLKSAAGAILLDLCTASPEKILIDLKAEDVWCAGAIKYNEKNAGGGGGGGNKGEEGIPHFNDNLLPLPAITQVRLCLFSFFSLSLSSFSSVSSPSSFSSLLSSSFSLLILRSLHFLHLLFSLSFHTFI